jgi:3-hydroxyacyl-CoA dehydrogenase
MNPSPFRIRKVAVLGAGVMGAQIAAHLTNADVETLLFDLPAKEGPKSGIAIKAIAGLAKLSPAPLAESGRGNAITPANYDEHLEWLRGCDLIIEAIAERLDWKIDLYKKIAPYVSDSAFVASNTSGLSINALAEALPAAMRPRFSGIHFFNPPRYMHLVELIPDRSTDPALLAGLEAFLTTTLGKGVVYAKDTPNFIGNRIGVFSILATMHHTEQFKLGFDAVDALTGPAIGRPKSATYRTSDVVGLDTMAHVIKTMDDTLPNDPWHRYFKAPAWLSALIEKGRWDKRPAPAFSARPARTSRCWTWASRTIGQPARARARKWRRSWRCAIPPKNLPPCAPARMRRPSSCGPCSATCSTTPRFIWPTLPIPRATWIFAIRWGYGWKLGPFETWQASGWKEIAGWIAEDIKAGKAMSDVPLPAWVSDGREGVHGKDGSWSPSLGRNLPRPDAPVYRRQLFPDPLLGESLDTGTTVWENEGVRLWHQGDDIGIVSFKTKMNTINDAVLDGLPALHWPGRATVPWPGDLAEWRAVFRRSRSQGCAEPTSARPDHRVRCHGRQLPGHQMRIKYSLVPVVAAVRGMAFGGGCEFQMHSARTVAALESYIGLVEAGVGLLPAGGGLKEVAVRAARSSIRRRSVQRHQEDVRDGCHGARSPAARWKPNNWAACAPMT